MLQPLQVLAEGRLPVPRRETRECACGLLTRGPRLLLAKRTLHRTYRAGLWDVVGGHLRPSEEPSAALQREVEEELGVTPTAFQRLACLPEPNPAQNGAHSYLFYHVTAWQGGEPAICNDEHSDFGWFTLSQALDLDLALPFYPKLFTRLLLG